MKNLYKLLTILFILLVPSVVQAADLDIICTDDQKPLITRNTDPLFKLSGFMPGDSAQRMIYIANKGTQYPCRIYLDLTGKTNTLTDKIQVTSKGIYDGNLSKFIDSGRFLFAELKPQTYIDRDITMYFPTDSNNTFSLTQASFDIAIQSEWGPEDQGDIAGTTDTYKKTSKTTLLSSIEEALGIGGGDEDIQKDLEENKNEEILGTQDDTQCKEKTLWWIVLLVQVILTVILIYLSTKHDTRYLIFLGISIILGILAIYLIKRIGCGCNPIWICKYSWIFNTILGISPVIPKLLLNKPRN